MRMASCSFDISSEKTATPQSARSAACSAMFRQKAVLPMLGRPPTTMRSDGCSPAVSLSRSAKPVGTPVTGLRWSCSAVDLANGVAQQRVDPHEGRPHLPVGDGEDLLLGALDQLLHVLAGLVAARGDAGAVVIRPRRIALSRTMRAYWRMLAAVGTRSASSAR